MSVRRRNYNGINDNIKNRKQHIINIKHKYKKKQSEDGRPAPIVNDTGQQRNNGSCQYLLYYYIKYIAKYFYFLPLYIFIYFFFIKYYNC